MSRIGTGYADRTTAPVSAALPPSAYTMIPMT
jgi:hypothetical protein